ncbi:MAG TPA: hypothetical protein VGD43_17165, partial [Micromonospora sp.]
EGTTFPMLAPDVAGAAYPANTGVADFAGRAVLTGIAGRVAGGVAAVGVENVRQRPPQSYGPGTDRPRPAHFSRAVLLTEGDRALAFMAGTAAVVDSRTRGETVEEQLDVTLDITDQLLSTGARVGGGRTLVGGLDALLHLVVYVARPADVPAVRARLADRVKVPWSCVVAPLTRDDLLVEVDGMAVVELREAVA